VTAISSHVLDVENGCPAAGVELMLFQDDDLLFSGVTNADGRCPALAELVIGPGNFRLRFNSGKYFEKLSPSRGGGFFIKSSTIEFSVDGDQSKYHIPLLASRFSLAMYKGS